MRGAGFAQPAAIEIDGADEASRPHARIGDRQYAATRGSANGDAPEIDIIARLEMGHDGIDVRDRPLEARDRYIGLAGIAAAIGGEAFAIDALRPAAAPALREDDHPAALGEIVLHDRRAPPS
nr:hypothetical protein [Nordella sp. HKS 07]